jgi:hypothetical protein
MNFAVLFSLFLVFFLKWFECGHWAVILGGQHRVA